jgi:signal transduction histidine kinase
MMIRRHLLATTLTLVILTVVLLALTDQLNIRNHQRTLLQQLRAIEEVDPDNDAGPSMGIYIYSRNSRSNEDRTNYILLDAQGHWTEQPAQNSNAPLAHNLHMPEWKEARQVLEKDELEGTDDLPWVKGPVMWAARAMSTPDTPEGTPGEPMILVGWRHVHAIRVGNVLTTYGVVVSAILIAFIVSVLIALRSARSVTGVIDEIASSSARLAEGDYNVSLPAQPTEELDRVSSAITQLARDLNQTNEELETEHQRLIRLEHLQRQFVADASHELRAPLTSMRVTLEAWQDGVIRPDEQPASLERLLHETERLGTLVTRLLDLSRIESGRETVQIEPVALPELIDQVVLAFHDLSCAPISRDLPSPCPQILADFDGMYRILHNLLENARRFTPANGQIRIWARVEGDTLRIGITDTGCGISPKDLPRIWNRFARAENARAREKAGSGLGLAIVKGLAEAMGGKVGAESTLGVGTTIWVALPLAKKIEE